MKIEVGKVYRLNCGSIILVERKNQVFGNRYEFLAKVISSEKLALTPENTLGATPLENNRRTEESNRVWYFDQDGKFDGWQGFKDYAMHISEEITP